ncbi:DUF4868 domain-containing protein [Brucella pseudintermedia]|uniref:DUF4868 domain-containing protein n=1 Tax=Brucella pseudintermedia TaxID=370111 RepID=UPI0013CF1973
MPTNLLAICRQNGSLQLKRVSTTKDVQDSLGAIFTSQEQKFNEGVTTEVPFDGGWKPDDHEMLVATSTQEMASIWNASLQNLTALQELDAVNFQTESIKALAVVAGDGGNRRLLLQVFSSRQILDRSFALILSGNTFRQLSEPSFCLGTSLTGILDANHIRFKSYSNVRTIFDLASLYVAATDAQIDTFAQHSSLHVADITAFKAFADQGIRKLVHAISSKDILGTYSVTAITTSASSYNFPITLHNNKITMPDNRADVKKLLHFLDEGFYRGAMSGTAYITNSKRPA